MNPEMSAINQSINQLTDLLTVNSSVELHAMVMSHNNY